MRQFMKYFTSLLGSLLLLSISVMKAHASVCLETISHVLKQEQTADNGIVPFPGFEINIERCYHYCDGVRVDLLFSLKKELEIAKVICKPPVLVPKTAQKSCLSKLGEMAHV